MSLTPGWLDFPCGCNAHVDIAISALLGQTAGVIVKERGQWKTLGPVYECSKCRLTITFLDLWGAAWNKV